MRDVEHLRMQDKVAKVIYRGGDKAHTADPSDDDNSGDDENEVR
jgi:hypothetical protein